jgi:hypothetical protein
VSGDDRSPGSDPIGDLQRWLVRSSARRMGKELKGQARRALGGSPDRGNVWEIATTEPPPEEAPECAWCPVCRAARKFRQSSPGIASQVAGAGDALFNVAQDTLSAFEAVLSGRAPGAGAASPGHAGDQERREHGAAAPGGTGWPAESGPGRPDPAGTWAGATEAADGTDSTPAAPAG